MGLWRRAPRSWSCPWHRSSGARRNRRRTRRSSRTCTSRETTSSRRARSRRRSSPRRPAGGRSRASSTSIRSPGRPISKRIERLYVANGFYQAEVVKDEVRPDPPDGVALEVQVREGKPTHVGKLDIEGLEALPAADRDAVLKELPLAPGAVFREEDWAATKRLLADRLRNRGYAKATVDGRALVDVKTQLADLTLIVDPGRRYFFGAIEVDTRAGRARAARRRLGAGAAGDHGGPPVQRRRPGGGAAARSSAWACSRPSGSRPASPTRRPRASPCASSCARDRSARCGWASGARADAIRNEARLVGDWTNRDFLGGMRKLTVHARGWAGRSSPTSTRSPPTTLTWRRATVRSRACASSSSSRASSGGRRCAGATRWRSIARWSRRTTRFSTRAMTGVVWQAAFDAGDLPRLPSGGRLPGRRADQQRGDRAADARLRDHQRPLLRLAVVPGRADHLGSPRPRVRPAQRHVPQPVDLQGGGGPLGGDFDYVRVLPDVRALPQLRRRQRADAGGAAALGRAVAVVGESRRQRGRHALLRGRLDLDARLRGSAPVAAVAGAAAAGRAQRRR